MFVLQLKFVSTAQIFNRLKLHASQSHAHVFKLEQVYKLYSRLG